MRFYTHGEGRFTREMELRATSGGSTVLNNAVAFDGQDKDHTVFLDIVAWGKNAENISTYFKKGDAITIHSAQLLSETYEGRDGMPRTKLFAKIESWDFPAGKRTEKPHVSTEEKPETSDDEHL